ncbi:hypothetical protein ACFQJD_04985 [Haloplanus sp. GCM10025708]|uniref:DUF7525 family protein n=1 Tax=Haloferacaceae TaxID=1644056 RepID=UPI00361F2100
MVRNTVQTDKGIGFGALFSILAVVGAVAMLAAPGQLGKAAGFAVAMIAASLAVVGAQVYG